MSILTSAELKSRFAAADRPSAKDFSDLIDFINPVGDAHINVLIANALSAFSSGLGSTQVIAGVNPPDYTNGAGKLWVQTLDGGSVVRNRVFSLQSDGGVWNWHSPNPIQPKSVMFLSDLGQLGLANTANYADVVAALLTYDGGTSDNPMWRLAKGYASNGTSEIACIGRFLLGADNVTFFFGNVGGERAHVLTTVEMPAHVHKQTANYSAQSGYDNGGALVLVSGHPETTSQHTAMDALIPNTQTAGGGAAHNTMPPYVVGYHIQRTDRKDYIIPAPAPVTLTYDGNGSDGGTAPASGFYTAGVSIVTVAANTFTNSTGGSTVFQHWNTSADDSGTSYDPADTFTISVDTVLYAIWGT